MIGNISSVFQLKDKGFVEFMHRHLGWYEELAEKNGLPVLFRFERMDSGTLLFPKLQLIFNL